MHVMPFYKIPVPCYVLTMDNCNIDLGTAVLYLLFQRRLYGGTATALITRACTYRYERNQTSAVMQLETDDIMHKRDITT